MELAKGSQKSASGSVAAPGGIAGAAAAGGFNFQAAVTAVAQAYMARGAPLGWLDGLVDDTPIAVSAETAGAGDDLRLELRAGEVVEVQIKRGLKARAELHLALVRLIDALGRKSIDFGVLIVCSKTSTPIREQLAQDIVRLGMGRDDGIGGLATEFRTVVEGRGYGVTEVFSRLRIVTVHALSHDQATIRAARAELAHMCPDQAAVAAAWSYLYQDAHAMMAARGARRRGEVFRAMRAHGLALSGLKTDMPLTALGRLCDWTLEVTGDFSILGVATPLPIDRAWIELAAFGREEDQTPASPGGLADALVRYHAWNSRRRPHKEACQVESLGHFRKHTVVVAGPGMGKTVLLKRIARRYARDGFPVLRVNAKAVGKRMKERAASFDETIFELGLDGSNLSPTLLRAADLEDWVLLCDGLDECEANQEAVAEGLARFVSGRPRSRVIVTTRPIGYRTSQLHAWRHYEVAPLGEDNVADRVALLLKHIWGPDDPRSATALQTAKVALEESDHARTAAMSPLLTAITAALISHGVALGRTKLRLYRAIFKLIEAEPPLRAGPPTAPSAVLQRTLDIAGWEATVAPTATADALLQRCGEALSRELDQPLLRGRATAEDCVNYWCELGVLERVQHLDQQAVTFVHKTLGEFAAGRYLASLPAAERAEVIRARFDDDAWVEVMNFAAAQGLGDEVAEGLVHRGFAGEEGHARLLRALEILDQAEPQLSSGPTHAILAATVEFVAADHPTRAHTIGLALAPAIRRAPAETALWCAEFLDHAQPWTRLVAWRCALEAGEGYFDFDALLVAFREILADHTGRRTMALPHRWDVRDSRRVLMQDFVTRALETILPRVSREQAQELLSEIEGAEDLVSLGLAEEIMALLTRLDLTSQVKFGERMIETMRNFRMPDFGAFADRQRVAYDQMLDALGADAALETSGKGDSTLYNVAAFFRICGLKESVVGDIWTWGAGTDVAAVREVFLGLAALAGLPLDQLAQEASNLKRDWNSDYGDRLATLFRRTPEVDPPEIHWERATDLNLDAKKVEAICRHRSTFLVPLAANLLAAALDKGELQLAVSRLLLDGQGVTLWAAGQLAAELPRDTCLKLLYARLEAPLNPGCEHLYDVLGKWNAPIDKLSTAAISQGLLADDPEVGIAAAKWVEQAEGLGAEFEPLLEQAYEHWRVTEEPYPVEGGAVPASPRHLLLRAMLKVSAISLERLLAYYRDARPDVLDVARSAIVQRLESDAEARRDFARLAGEGLVPAALLAKALDTAPPFDAADVAAMCALFKNPSPDLRLAATGLFKGGLLEGAERQGWAQLLRYDPQSEVREAAIRVME